MENGKKMRCEDTNTSAYPSENASAYASENASAYASENATAYASENSSENADLLYKGEQQPGHFSRVVAATHAASPIAVREVRSSRESYKPIITSPIIIDEDVIYVDVDNADNIAEKDLNDNHSRFADVRRVQFMTPQDAALYQLSSRPPPERTLRKVISLLGKRPTSTSRRELLAKFAAFFNKSTRGCYPG
jgi:hypothetical protein